MTSGVIMTIGISEFGSAIKWYQRNGQYHNNYQMLCFIIAGPNGSFYEAL